jgi:hypothetical protein
MAKQLKTCAAPYPVYRVGALSAPGEHVTTYHRPGREWNDLSSAGKVPVDMGRSHTPPDEDHEGMTLVALQAIAVAKHLNPGTRAKPR